MTFTHCQKIDICQVRKSFELWKEMLRLIFSMSEQHRLDIHMWEICEVPGYVAHKLNQYSHQATHSSNTCAEIMQKFVFCRVWPLLMLRRTWFQHEPLRWVYRRLFPLSRWSRQMMHETLLFWKSLTLHLHLLTAKHLSYAQKYEQKKVRCHF